MSTKLAIDEFSDLVRMLRQVEQYGGSIQQQLASLAELLEDRRRTQLQERVGRLSAKMTIAMVVFLFPALLVFVAGPGIRALLRALEQAGG